MKTYVALLRAVNIGGKNKISMEELRKAFEEKGFINVKTYINSGNIIFSSQETNIDKLIEMAQELILEKFSLEILLTVIELDRLEDIFARGPDWWHTKDKGSYDNIIFVLPPKDTTYIIEIMGEGNNEYEKIATYSEAIYWSTSLKDFPKTKWSKMASSSINNMVTMRTANTVEKIIKLANKKD